ncbi:hypothetical protein IFM46972_09569, partial [Aspergillus udagawae]
DLDIRQARQKHSPTWYHRQTFSRTRAYRRRFHISLSTEDMTFIIVMSQLQPTKLVKLAEPSTTQQSRLISKNARSPRAIDSAHLRSSVFEDAAKTWKSKEHKLAREMVLIHRRKELVCLVNRKATYVRRQLGMELRSDVTWWNSRDGTTRPCFLR